MSEERSDERAEPAGVEQLAARDFEDYYRTNRDHLVRALVLTLGSADLGVEAADEAMVRTYQRWRTVHTYRNPMGWTYTVGVNWARNRLARRRREAPGRLTEPAVNDPAVPDPVVDQALAGLPLEQRTVIVLRYYLDWSNQEIADALRIPVGTVKSRVSRALERLGRTLGEEP